MTPLSRYFNGTASRRVLITCSFMLAACVCYLIGYTPGLKLFFLIGAALETVFWLRLFRNRRKHRLKPLTTADDSC